MKDATGRCKLAIQMSRTFLYFGYGSNLLKQRVQLKNPSAVYVDTARLDDFHLTFDYHRHTDKSGWKGASATIRPCPGGSVWGVVWQLDNNDRASLDQQERNYFKRSVKVTSTASKTYECMTYEFRGEYDFSHKPSPHYKDLIVRGAKQNNLPSDYIDQLINIDDNGYEGEVDLYNSVIKELNQQR